MDLVDSLYGTIRSCLTTFQTSTSNIKLNNRELKIVRLLGEGGYSYVYLVSDSAGQLYALKQIRAFSDESIELANREVAAYQLFKDASIISVIDFATVQDQSGKTVYILLPYYKQGNLQDLINKNLATGKTLSDVEALKLFRGIVKSLIQLHERLSREAAAGEDEPLMKDEPETVAYAHFDLKPANLMLTDDLDIVLMDLGSCKPARRRILTRSDALKVQDEAAEHSTMPFRAPELFDCPTDSWIDEKVDIWSLGCVFFALLYGHSPFENSSTASGSIALAVLNCQYVFPDVALEIDALNTLIRRCLVLRPDDRPSARGILAIIDEMLGKRM